MASNCSWLNGLTIQPVAPAARPSAFLPGSDSVVSRRIGVLLKHGSVRNWRVSSMPFMLGMWTSVITRSTVRRLEKIERDGAILRFQHFVTRASQREGDHFPHGRGVVHRQNGLSHNDSDSNQFISRQGRMRFAERPLAFVDACPDTRGYIGWKAADLIKTFPTMSTAIEAQKKALLMLLTIRKITVQKNSTLSPKSFAGMAGGVWGT